MTLHQRRMRAWRGKHGRTKMPLPPKKLAEVLARLDTIFERRRVGNLVINIGEVKRPDIRVRIWE